MFDKCVSAPVPPTGHQSGQQHSEVWIRYYDAYRLYVAQWNDGGGKDLVGTSVVQRVDAVSCVGTESGGGGGVVDRAEVVDLGVLARAGSLPVRGEHDVRRGLGCVGPGSLSSLPCRGEQRVGHHSGVEAGSEHEVVADSVGEGGGHVERTVGRWHWSNTKKRERRKAKKFPSVEKKKLMEKPWRGGVVSDSGLHDQVVEKGFFKDCDENVRKDLRDSRAKMLIAQNNLRARKAEKSLQAVDSVQGIVQQMVDITASVAKLQKQTADEAVHGWARTVASTMAKSITECSSSVPTLESVGFGASGLKSTDGEVLDPARVAAFDRDMKYVEDSFAGMDAYSEEDYKFAVQRVKRDFPDVAYTKVQREVAASKAVAVQRLLSLGVDYQKVQDAIYPDGEDFL